MPFYNLKNLEKKLEPADVILVHGKSVISKIIRAVTESYWNHSLMYLGNNQIIESNWNGVKIKSLEDIAKKEIRVYRHKKITPYDKTHIPKLAKQDLGKKYDYLQLLGLGWLLLTNKRGKAHEIGSKNKFICSELVAKPYQICRLLIKDNIPYDQISPADFDESKYFRRLEIKK